MSHLSTGTDAAVGSDVPIVVPKLKYFLHIENRVYEWPVSTVTREQIAELGRWDPSVGVLIIDRENNERQLHEGEVVHLEKGLAFAKKVHWKRG